MTADQTNYKTLNKLYAKKVELTEELESLLDLWVSLEGE